MTAKRRSTLWLLAPAALGLAVLACALPGDTTNPADSEATLNAAVQATVNAQQTAGATLPPASPAILPTDTTALPPTPTEQPPIAVTLQYPTDTPLPPTAPPADTPVSPSATPTSVTTSDFTRPNGQPIHALHAGAAPVIDCSLGEWGALPNRVDQVTFGAANWSGPADDSADYQMSWDANNLYLGAHVTDDVHAQVALGDQLFKGDGLEILFDANLAADFNDKTLSADDYQIGFTPGENKVGGPDSYMWFPRARAGRPPNVQVSGCEDTGNGFFLEAAVPWATFGINPAGGAKFGFVLSASDNDAPGTQQQQSLVSSVGTRKLIDPTTWGTLVLDP